MYFPSKNPWINRKVFQAQKKKEEKNACDIPNGQQGHHDGACYFAWIQTCCNQDYPRSFHQYESLNIPGSQTYKGSMRSFD